MMWTIAQRERAIELHAQGWTDSQMADHFGITRPRMAVYRNNCLHLAANTTRKRSHTTPCEACGSRVSVKRYREHMRERHNAVRMKGGRPKTTVARLRPLQGRFDSSRALHYLVEHWKAA
jgi:hypothetical protein